MPVDEPAASVQRLLPARPAVVYDAWLDPEALSDWMCPRPARAVRVELDPRIGGRYRLGIEEAGHQFDVEGEYLELVPPSRLRFTWTCSTWTDPTLRSLVTVTLEPHGVDETLMTIRHTLLPPDLVDQHEDGWSTIADQLADELRRPLSSETS